MESPFFFNIGMGVWSAIVYYQYVSYNTLQGIMYNTKQALILNDLRRTDVYRRLIYKTC